jgi:ABC-type branched-subunit amino acid transport system substrate-binding protein
LAIGAAACSAAESDTGPVRVGVLLPLTGENALGFEQSLDWALAEINQRGLCGGRPVQLDYEDLGGIADDGDYISRTVEAAGRLLNDPDVPAVIGTDYDDTTFALAPAFIKAQKLLISPSATTAELTRAFGGNDYVWRTVESDVAQAEVMVRHAKATGATSAAVISTFDLYGTTFFDWLPYHAEQAGLAITDVMRLADSDDCRPALSRVLRAPAPDVLFLIPSTYAQTRCFVTEARALSPKTRLIFSDGAQYEGLFASIAGPAEGVEGVSIEARRPSVGDGDSEFDLAFEARLHHIPPPYAANAYDALALVAYALERAGCRGGQALSRAYKEVVAAKGERTAWNGEGMRKALDLIARGTLPDIEGATGDLQFDERLGVEITDSTYAIWQIAKGEQQWDQISAGARSIPYPANYFADGGAQSAFSMAAQSQLASDVAAGAAAAVPARTGFWAFIGAFSHGYDNYRHQADALAYYQALRRAGVDDDHIVLVLADDLGKDPRNPEPGVVRNVAGGPDLNRNVVIDYKLDATFGAAEALAILSGSKSARTPTVLASDAGDDVLVFWVGHGSRAGLLVGGADAASAEAGAGSFIDPIAFAGTVNAMADEHRYRYLTALVETCHGGALGGSFQAPRAVLMTGAGESENSLGAAYDPAARLWRADAFATAVLSRLDGAPTTSLAATYKGVYLELRGSHAKLFNAAGAGALPALSWDTLLRR